MKAQSVTDATCRLLWSHGLAPMTEYVLPNGRRLDIAAVGKDGSLLGVEVKIDRRDFERDLKWTDCAHWCFIFYIAVPCGFPLDLIHPGVRVIEVDGEHARITRRMGRGLLQPHLWHTARGRYAFKPPAAATPLHSVPSGDRARARLWMP